MQIKNVIVLMMLNGIDFIHLVHHTDKRNMKNLHNKYLIGNSKTNFPKLSLQKSDSSTENNFPFTNSMSAYSDTAKKF